MDPSENQLDRTAAGASEGVDGRVAQAKAAGDPSELLSVYRPYLSRLASDGLGANLRQRLDADDVVQEVCLRVAKGFAGFVGMTESEWLGWLRVLVRNAINDLARQHTGPSRDVQRTQAFSQPEGDGAASMSWFQPAAGSLTASAIAIEGEWAVRVKAAIERLPEEERLAVRLRFVEGKKLTEVAAGCGKRPDATVGLLRRALKRLRADLGMP